MREEKKGNYQFCSVSVRLVKRLMCAEHLQGAASFVFFRASKGWLHFFAHSARQTSTRVVPKVMSNNFL